MKLNFLGRFSNSSEILYFIKITPVGAEFFYADGGTDRHEETNSGFTQFCESLKKKGTAYLTKIVS